MFVTTSPKDLLPFLWRVCVINQLLATTKDIKKVTIAVFGVDIVVVVVDIIVLGVDIVVAARQKGGVKRGAISRVGRLEASWCRRVFGGTKSRRGRGALVIGGFWEIDQDEA